MEKELEALAEFVKEKKNLHKELKDMARNALRASFTAISYQDEEDKEGWLESSWHRATALSRPGGYI